MIVGFSFFSPAAVTLYWVVGGFIQIIQQFIINYIIKPRFSRTWDDSFNNKVLVLGSENQNKGNRTPYEYFNGKNNSRAWQEFKARVETSRFPHSKKQRILLQKFDEEGFKERNLNDTRTKG